VLVDNRERKIKIAPEQAVRICDRHRGVGADGVMLLVPCASGKADWAWDFYNADGSEAEMCGNGARCFARFVERVAGVKGGFTFETKAGIITATIKGDRITVNLTSPQHLRLNEAIPLSTGKTEIHSLNTGVPHAVLFVPDADKAMVTTLGPEVRRHTHFAPRGTNVNFVQLKGDNMIRVRTYERGVEGETLACGTGVSASAMISARLHGLKSPVKVLVQGGDLLEVAFDDNGRELSNVRLTGPADFVYEGHINV
jgi:diaminopimelate epimerase